MKRDRKKEIERIIKVREYIMKNENIDKTTYVKRLGIKLNAYNQIEKRGANANYLSGLFQAFGISADYILSGIKSPTFE